MKQRSITFLTLGVAAAAMLVSSLAPVSAQLAGDGNAKADGAKGGGKGKGKGKAKGVPVDPIKTVEINQPNFGGPGVWNVPYITNMGTQNFITAGGKATCEQFPTGSGGNPTPSCAPFTPLGREVFAERRKTDSATDPEGYCLPPGVPRMMYTPYPMKVIQEPNFVTFIYEGGAHVWRQIPIGPKGSLKHEEDPNPTYLGDSIGWWEGDTLVIDVIGFNDRTWLDFAGHPHGEKLHVIERYRRVDSINMEYTAIIEDPEYYTQPWTVVTAATYNPTNKLLEYICQENERDSAHNEEHLRKLGIDPGKIR